MADSSPLGSCSLDRLAQLFQEILKMQSQKSVCSRAPAGKANGRGCITCNDALQCCSSQCRLTAPTKRRNEDGHVLDECFPESTKRSKRAKVETIQLKKDFKETGKELESMRIRAELRGELGPARDRLGDVESLRGDVIFVLEDSENDGPFYESPSHRFVLLRQGLRNGLPHCLFLAGVIDMNSCNDFGVIPCGETEKGTVAMQMVSKESVDEPQDTKNVPSTELTQTCPKSALICTFGCQDLDQTHPDFLGQDRGYGFFDAR